VHTAFNDETQLVFGKHRGQWALILSKRNGTETTALLQAPRSVRQEVLSGGHIEQLIREGAVQIESQIAEREFAIKEAERILLALERTKP
jgi:hypothetical protein